MGKNSKYRDTVSGHELLEIDDGIGYIGFHDALNLVYSNICPLGTEVLPLVDCVNRVAAEDLIGRIDNPSSDVSLKDGFAIRSFDIADASFDRPVKLKIIGSAFAGTRFTGKITQLSAVKILSGSPIPEGADAVVSDEFCLEQPTEVLVRANAERGRNILRAGEEIKAGDLVIAQGKVLLSGYLGLAAAAGLDKIPVYRRPRVAIIAIGDEVVAPGRPLAQGQLYASNLVTMAAWLASLGICYQTSVIKDDGDEIRQEMLKCLSGVDIILTSGGAWGSERDLVVGVLDALGWKKLFHHVRMGPGKGVAFGLLQNKPVFCLPGGPASNEKAFLQFALPGISRLGGNTHHPLPSLTAKLTKNVRGRHRNWTEFKDAYLTRDGSGNYQVTPYHGLNRLQSIARATCLICIPEGKESINEGELTSVQLLTPTLELATAATG